MKIIFLDFDGVLNDTKCITRVPTMLGRKWGHDSIRTYLVRDLNEIIRQTGAKVVVSSSWRQVFDASELQQILCEAGFEGEVIDTTPVMCENNRFSDEGRFYDRADEIRAWLYLRDNDGGRNEPIDGFVVLDDVACGFDSAYGTGFAKHIVFTNGDHGLSLDDQMKALVILSCERMDS